MFEFDNLYIVKYNRLVMFVPGHHSQDGEEQKKNMGKHIL